METMSMGGDINGNTQQGAHASALAFQSTTSAGPGRGDDHSFEPSVSFSELEDSDSGAARAAATASNREAGAPGPRSSVKMLKVGTGAAASSASSGSATRNKKRRAQGQGGVGDKTQSMPPPLRIDTSFGGGAASDTSPDHAPHAPPSRGSTSSRGPISSWLKAARSEAVGEIGPSTHSGQQQTPPGNSNYSTASFLRQFLYRTVERTTSSSATMKADQYHDGTGTRTRENLDLHSSRTTPAGGDHYGQQQHSSRAGAPFSSSAGASRSPSKERGARAHAQLADRMLKLEKEHHNMLHAGAGAVDGIGARISNNLSTLFDGIISPGGRRAPSPNYRISPAAAAGAGGDFDLQDGPTHLHLHQLPVDSAQQLLASSATTAAPELQQPSSSGPHLLSKFSVMAIVFFNVSGGPWGSEEIFSDYGPLVGILSTFLVAAIWSYPQIQITSELSSAFPVNGGYSLWVTEAFGPFWGTMESYWSWISGVVDNAVYPVLLFDAVKQYYNGGSDTHFDAMATTSAAAATSPALSNYRAPFHDDHDRGRTSLQLLALAEASDSTTPTHNYAVLDWMFTTPVGGYCSKLLLIFILSLPNMISTQGTGQFLQILGILQMLPFVVFVVLALGENKVDFSILLQYDFGLNVMNSSSSSSSTSSSSSFYGSSFSDFDPCAFLGAFAAFTGTAKFTDFLCVLYWNLSGWDCVSTVAGEIEKPERNLAPALLYSLFLTVGQYIIILSVAAGTADVPWSEWEDGSLPEIVKQVCGSYAGLALLAASCIGNAGMFIAELMEDSYQLEGLAAADVIPRWTKFDYKHPYFETPLIAMVPSLIFCALCLPFDFASILAIDNCFASAAALLEILAYFELRKSRPEMDRPYRVESRFLLYFSFPLAFLFGVFVFAKSLLKGGVLTVINLFLLVAGFPLGRLLANRFEALYLRESVVGGGGGSRGGSFVDREGGDAGPATLSRGQRSSGGGSRAGD